VALHESIRENHRIRMGEPLLRLGSSAA